MKMTELELHKDEIIDIALDCGCYVRECSSIHWKVSGTHGVLNFYPTTGTIYNAATNKTIRGDKASSLAVIKHDMAKCARLVQGSRF